MYANDNKGALPERFNLIGVSRGDQTDEEFQQVARESIEQFSRRPPDDEVLGSLVERMRYVAGTTGCSERAGGSRAHGCG